ncbi:hypothetical protein GWI33_002365 [Rhynchophorus ferrugineus]|uniref:Tudor domain-containing protein n=1 Tax=Rhynchophorus ferrugineus TaxID=354439 RepID=A0A834IKK5_RHYFE|nr:hypothetical protein GWI33_002365 [Rhynchophorus ferrugineus]
MTLVYLGTSNNSELNNLTDNMKNFYRRKEVQKEYSVHIPVIQESLNCVTLICGEYHRARILEVILNSNEARVFCIDYGRVCKVHFSGIYFLKTDFAELPAQAIRCQLHHIAPKLRNRIWPRSSCTAFKEMVNRKNIKMKIVYVNWDEESTGVLLTDITDVDNTYNVNEEVVNKGFGYWENQSIYPPLKLGNSTSNVERLYFFPMFLELELGFAPSASEMYTLEELGVIYTEDQGSFSLLLTGASRSKTHSTRDLMLPISKTG